MDVMFLKNLLIRRKARPMDFVTRSLLLILLVMSSKRGVASDVVTVARVLLLVARRSTSRIRVPAHDTPITSSNRFTRSILLIDCRQSGQVEKVSTHRIRIS